MVAYRDKPYEMQWAKELWYGIFLNKNVAGRIWKNIPYEIGK